MKTNKIGLLSLAMTGVLAMAVTVSCEKESVEKEKNRLAVVEFRLSDDNGETSQLKTTKASGNKHNAPAYDTAKNTLQFFVFNENGQLQAYKCLLGAGVSNTGSMKVDVPPGIKKVMVVANAHPTSDLSIVSTFSEFGTKLSKLEKEDVGDFTMVGKLDSLNVQFPSTDPVYADVSLKRMVARVHLGTLKTDFTSGFADSTLTDVKVYLINYCSKADYASMSGVDSTILNRDSLRANDAANMKMSNIDRYTVGTVGSEAVTVDQYFYMYGNNRLASPNTRLVIEGKLAGYTYYYPIDIHDENSDAISANNSFDILDVTIRRPGITDPSGEISKGTLKFRITTDDWVARDTSNVVF